MTELIRGWFLHHRRTVFRLANTGLAVAAAIKLGIELNRLVLVPGSDGGIDLQFRYDEAQRWFAGLPVYSDLQRLT